MFGETEYLPERSYAAVPLEEQLEALSAAVTAGKIRHVGLSNETAWGIMQCCRLGALLATWHCHHFTQRYLSAQWWPSLPRECFIVLCYDGGLATDCDSGSACASWQKGLLTCFVMQHRSGGTFRGFLHCRMLTGTS